MLVEAKFGDCIVHEAIRLAPGDTLRIEDGCGILVEAREGSLWLTQEREGVDSDVLADAPFRLDRNGAAIITTHRASVVRLRAPVTHGYAARIEVRRRAGAERVVVYDASPCRPTPFAARAQWRNRVARWLSPARRRQSLARDQEPEVRASRDYDPVVHRASRLHAQV